MVKGGKGRNKKLKAIDIIKDKEIYRCKNKKEMRYICIPIPF